MIANKHTLIHINNYIHTQTHIHNQTHLHSHTHTHTHTYTYVPRDVGIVSNLVMREHVGVLPGTYHPHGGNRASPLQVAEVEAPG